MERLHIVVDGLSHSSRSPALACFRNWKLAVDASTAGHLSGCTSSMSALVARRTALALEASCSGSLRASRHRLACCPWMQGHAQSRHASSRLHSHAAAGCPDGACVDQEGV